MGLPPALDSLPPESTLVSSPQSGFPPPADRPPPPAASRSWPQIDGYEIISKLGQGGMGSVFLARDRKLGRQVAIKVVSQVFRNPDGLLGRFDAEIQTLAGLQHTHIAQLHSAGLQGDLPYFVMEYVDGPNLEQLAREPMKPVQIAGIVGKLCDAVGLCHGLGILHRDLKPANILMTQTNQPKIADFGLAKVIGADTSTTKTGEILGTPAYMPPEQASGVVKNLTPACDIYSLGAILYRLMTGRPPFAAEEPVQTIMMVISAEPVRPRRLVQTIPIDLETICLKCLEKNPLRRYPTVAALQEDLQRFLDGRPILARPVGVVEKVFKWAKRNPAVAVSGTAAALALIGAVIGLTLHNQRLADELDRSRRLAEHGSDLTSWLIQEHSVALGRISGTTGSRHQLVDRVREFLDSSFADMPSDPKYTRRLGFSYASLAGISGGTEQNHLGDLAAAETHLLKALELYDLAGQQANDADQLNRLRGDAYLSLTVLYRELQNPAGSEKYFQMARTTIGQLQGSDWETQFLKIRLHQHEVERHAAANRHSEALATLALIESSTGSAGPDAKPEHLASMEIWVASNRAASLEGLGKLPDAESAYQRASDLSGKLHLASPNDSTLARNHSSALVQLGDIQFAQSDGEAALQSYQKAHAIVAPLAERDPGNVELAFNLAIKLARLGTACRFLSDLESAARYTRQAIGIQERLEKEGKSSLSMQQNLANDVLTLAEILADQRDIQAATQHFDRHRQLCLRILESSPDSTFEWNKLAENHFSHGLMLYFDWSERAGDSQLRRESADFQAVAHQFDESVRYVELIRKSSGLNYHQQQFLDQVLAIRRVLEESLGKPAPEPDGL